MQELKEKKTAISPPSRHLRTRSSASEVAYSFLRQLTFSRARDQKLAKCFELRRQVYEQDLGHLPVDRYDEEAHHMIAEDANHEVVATFRLLGPEQRPFDVDQAVDLSHLLGPERTPAVIGRLCIRKDYRTITRSRFVQLGMLKLSYAYARKRGWTDFLLYTYPNLVKFYRGAFFELTGITFEHPDWGEVILMHLDLLGFAARYAGSEEPTARLLLHTELPNFLV